MLLVGVRNVRRVAIILTLVSHRQILANIQKMGQKKKQRSEDLKQRQIRLVLALEASLVLARHRFNCMVLSGVFVPYDNDSKVMV